MACPPVNAAPTKYLLGVHRRQECPAPGQAASADYRPLAVNTAAPEGAESSISDGTPAEVAAQPIAKTLGIDLGQREQPPLAVLDLADSEYQPLATRDAGEISKDGKIDREELLAFLKRFAPQPPDAEILLADALAGVKREDKRVLMVHTGVYCGPCVLLSRFLHRHWVALSPDYVLVKIDDDRWRRGKEVIDRLRKSEQRSIPWMAILDADGKALATSDGPDGNIGFPSAPKGIDHFIEMLSSTARRLDQEQLALLRESLQRQSSR